MSAYEDIRSAAVRLIERRKLDVGGDAEATRLAVVEAVDAYRREADRGAGRHLADPGQMIERVFDAVTGFGALTDVLADPAVEEVFIEGDRVSFIRGGALYAPSIPTTEQENRRIVDRLLADTDRHLDAANPIVQARVLNDSARLTAVMPPVSDRLSVTIRRYALRRETLASLVELGSVTLPAAGLLWVISRTDSSVVVSGPPGAGKTSLLAALMAPPLPARVFAVAKRCASCMCRSFTARTTRLVRRLSMVPGRSRCGISSRSSWPCDPTASSSER